MKYRVLILACAVAVVPALAAPTYKWVDKNGNVHYSDTPVEGAERVDLPEPTTFDAPDIKLPEARQSDDAEPEFEYTEFGFISPKQNQVFWAMGGEIPVQLSLEPALREGHEIRLFYNGERVENLSLAGLGTTLTGVFRGAHTIRAVIVDRSERERATTGPVTFHVKQRSLANPQN